MSEISSKLTVEQQVLVSAVADELSETTTIHQQVVLRMLAIATEHDLNAANLLEDLGVEMRSVMARELPSVVSGLNLGLPVVESLARSPRVAPESAVMALEVARSRGLEKPLNEALLNRTNRRESESSGSESYAAIEQVNKLLLKYIFVIAVFSFLALFIIPQFTDMYEEFGIELPLSMSSFIEFMRFFGNYGFLFPFILLAILPYLIWRYPRFFTSLYTRWIPSRWQQPVLSKRAKQEFSTAWVVQTSDALPETAKQFVNVNGVGTEELETLTAAEKTEAKTGIMQALAKNRSVTMRTAMVASRASSQESAAWILRKMSHVNQVERRRRGLDGLGILLWIGNLFVLAIAAWGSIAIFQCLFYIITGLSG